MERQARPAFLNAETLSNIFSQYERLPVEERRDRYDEMIYAVMEANPEYFQVYTVWRPNALDSMDAQMIGRATVDIDDTIAYLNSLNVNNLRDRVEPPFARTLAGVETYVIRRKAF